MKKVFLVLLAVVLLMSCVSCAVFKKNVSRMASYKDPQSLGGYWNVTMQTGQTFNHVKCTYWGTEDDTAIFEMDDGTLICQSGAVVCVRCN